MEIYHNNFYGTLGKNRHAWIFIRGGTARIWNNKLFWGGSWGTINYKNPLFQEYQLSADIDSGSICDPEDCPDGVYPGMHQIGRGVNNTLEPIYMWGNTHGPNGTENTCTLNTAYAGGLCHPDNTYANFFQSGRDYYLNVGAPAGYAPLPYPHPIRSGGTIPDDTTPPVVTNNTVATVACDASPPLDSHTLSVTTNEAAYCAYCEDSVTGCDSGSGYATILAAGAAYATSGGTTHNQTLTNLTCGTTHTYRSACKDRSTLENANTSSTASAITVGAAEGDTTAPVISNIQPASGTVFVCSEDPRPVTLSLYAEDESGVTGCKYNTTDVAYASMSGTLSATGGTPVETLADSYSASNYDTARSMYVAIRKERGQSFTGIAGTLDNIEMMIQRVGSPTGNATVKVYAHTGTYGTSSLPTGAALATSDNFDVTTIPTDMAHRTFSFSGANRITLEASTYYVFALVYGGGDSSNYLNIGADNSSPSHAGNALYLTGDDVWTVNTPDDLPFYVNVMVGSGNDYSASVNVACGSEPTYYFRCTDGTNANSSSSSTRFQVASSAPANVYQFEDCSLTAPMVEIEDVQASGGSYIQTSVLYGGSASCTVNAPAAGTYRIKARVYTPDTGSDSAWWAVNGGSQDLWHINDNLVGEASWYNVWKLVYVSSLTADPAIVTLSEGENTIVFYGREPRTRLDYFYLEAESSPPVNPGDTTNRVGSGSNTLRIGNSKNTLRIN